MTAPKCQLCGEAMEYRTISSGNASGIAGGLLVFALGVVLCVTGVGALIGVPLCIVALFMGGKRERFLVCPGCRAKIPAVK